MITHYGYSDGSGEYYITIDTYKCNGCGKCVKHCPQSTLQLETILIDLEDKTVASVREEHRKKIKYTCSSCKPESNNAPCILACESKAIKCTWNTH
ncbi:MAG: 4Fe-4S binding protein [Candidatus Bathyarchaeia archaeon]